MEGAIMPVEAIILGLEEMRATLAYLAGFKESAAAEVLKAAIHALRTSERECERVLRADNWWCCGECGCEISYAGDDGHYASYCPACGAKIIEEDGA